MNQKAELVLDAKAELGEGAIWVGNEFWWVDIIHSEVHRFNPATGQDRVTLVGQMVGTVVPRAKGGAMVAVKEGLGSFDLDTGALNLVARPEAHIPSNRFNDGKCDPAGRFWAGTMTLTGDAWKDKVGTLYSLDADGRVTARLSEVCISNGIVWTADAKTMYFVDTVLPRVDAFDFDNATGAISNRRPAVNFPEGVGSPDGMTIDADDNLWIAMWGGWKVLGYNPRTGQPIGVIDVPAANVTSCAFGGPNLEDLYITSAWAGVSEAERAAQQPHAGSVFHARPGVKGVPAVAFAG
jgi:sugar lactone lactonase YvrE